MIVGTHLCGELSLRVIELFERCPSMSALILSPCCQVKRDLRTKRLAKTLKRDTYALWCLHLLTSLRIRPRTSSDEEPAGPGSFTRTEMLQDDNVRSKKNTYILAAKKLGHLMIESAA